MTKKRTDKPKESIPIHIEDVEGLTYLQGEDGCVLVKHGGMWHTESIHDFVSRYVGTRTPLWCPYDHGQLKDGKCLLCGWNSERC